MIHKRRNFFTKSGPSMNTVRPRDSASILSQNQNASLEAPNGLYLENLEALTPLSNELLLYQKQQQQNIASCEKAPLQTVRSVGTRVRILGNLSTTRFLGGDGNRRSNLLPVHVSRRHGQPSRLCTDFVLLILTSPVKREFRLYDFRAFI